jgi:hypothetical protein
MTEVRCPWEECLWNNDATCERHIIMLTNKNDPTTNKNDPTTLDCDQYETGCENDNE